MADGPLPVEGVDYTGGANISQLYAAGKRFACRYGGPGGSWKHLTAAEAQALSAAGIAVVANAEGSADGLRNGFAAGASWASLAEAHFRACGMPPDRPIYFSVDFDTASGDWAALDAAMDGAASMIGRNRVGVYGEYSIIEHFAANRKAVWYWQTYAWSGGRWSAHNHIEQYRNGVSLAGIQLDLDRAYGNDFGQWTTIGADMTEEQAGQLAAVFQAVFYGGGSCGDYRAPDNGHPQSNSFVQKLDYTARELDALASKVGGIAVPAPAPVDVAALVAALRPELDAAAERAVRKVLGGLDETA